MGCAASSDAPVGGLHQQLLKTNISSGVWYKYSKGKLLGAGMTGAVHVATKRDTGEKFAIKSINKRKLDPAQLGELKNEVDLLKQLDHPNIVRLYETYEHNDKMYLIMQLLSGKDLGKVLFKTEAQVAKVMRKICAAIAYCHAKGITHRDIKLENFVFTSKDNLEDIVVIDFGIGKKNRPDRSEIIESKKELKRNMKTVCGTPYYMSPQVLDGRYDEKCDCWALGVLAYILLCSKPPFNGKYKHQLDSSIRSGVVRYPHNMSIEAKELISNLLKVNSKERWSCAEALKCKWLSVAHHDDAKQMLIEKHTLENMVSFQQSGKLKKLALMIRAYSENNNKLKNLKEAFDTIDSGNTGTISLEELKSALSRHKISMDAKAVFDSLDVDKQGVISYTEFLAASLEDDLEDDKEKLRMLFDQMDITKNGMITAKDIKMLLGSDSRKYNIEELLKEGDITGNSAISYEEFVRLMSKTRFTQTSEAFTRNSTGMMTDSGLVSLGNSQRAAGNNASAIKEEAEEDLKEGEGGPAAVAEEKKAPVENPDKSSDKKEEAPVENPDKSSDKKEEEVPAGDVGVAEKKTPEAGVESEKANDQAAAEPEKGD